MPELRKDPITDRWVIISASRGKRPSDYLTSVIKNQDTISPFAPGNEQETPPEIYALRPKNTRPNTAGWQLRVVPNKYPAVVMNGAYMENPEASTELFTALPGTGIHEVIIDMPEPDKRLEELTAGQITEVFKVFRQRLGEHRKEPRLKYALIFKNHGPAAGATLCHSHCQLIALPMVPAQVTAELSGSRQYYQKMKRCIFCDLIEQELKNEVRVVYDTEAVVALSSFAARVPYETWILPRAHFSHFETASDVLLEELSVVFKTVMQKINTALQKPSYNFVLHTGPLREEALVNYHWHLEILPRVANVAGFEWGTGMFINSISPEEAAVRLKKIVI